MRTVALSEHTATRLAYRQYLGLLAEDDRGFRQAFRTAFFRAMREQLTPRQYEVLWMVEVEGLSCKQCAERLGISPSAVSRHCSRGKKRLRTLLAYNLELRHQYFIPKHQHAPFSEQNLTSLPSRIIFVVRTAHILPHIEQV